MAKRPKHSRWRRLPGVYRFHEEKGPDPNLEPTRLTLYVPARDLDAAEAQARKAKVETIQEYCADLLRRAIEAERVREHVAEIEARRGPFEGLHQIAEDPEYLAEWSAQVGLRDRIIPAPTKAPVVPEPAPEEDPIHVVQEPEIAIPESVAEEAVPLKIPDPVVSMVGPTSPDSLTPSGEVILRHAGQSGDDPRAFLPSLRRGESSPIAEIAELARALQTLESEYQGSALIHRRIAYALHRLALEAQVIHTDAWPGAFDAWTVDTIRAVQESVDRVLSGQDIRYYPHDSHPEDSP